MTWATQHAFSESQSWALSVPDPSSYLGISDGVRRQARREKTGFSSLEISSLMGETVSLRTHHYEQEATVDSAGQARVDLHLGN